MITLKHARIILAIGFFTVFLAQVVFLRTPVGDFATGTVYGLGLGLLIVGLYATAKSRPDRVS